MRILSKRSWVKRGAHFFTIVLLGLPSHGHRLLQDLPSHPEGPALLPCRLALPWPVDISGSLWPEGLRSHLRLARFPENDFLPVRVVSAYNPRTTNPIWHPGPTQDTKGQSDVQKSFSPLSPSPHPT